MSEGAVSVERFEGQLVRFESSWPFDEVLARLESLVGTAALAEKKPAGSPDSPGSLGDQYHDAMQRQGGVTRENFEDVVRHQLGESDFMLFHGIDHSECLPVCGITRRVLRLILGNPIIAITMMRNDLTAGLFAPVEVLLIEDETGGGCAVAYVLPSSLIAAADTAMLAAAPELDRKLHSLISRCTGLPAPPTAK